MSRLDPPAPVLLHPDDIQKADALRRAFSGAGAACLLKPAIQNISYDDALKYRFAYEWGHQQSVNATNAQRNAYIRMMFPKEQTLSALFAAGARGDAMMDALYLYGRTHIVDGRHDYAMALFGYKMFKRLGDIAEQAERRLVTLHGNPGLMGEPLPPSRDETPRPSAEIIPLYPPDPQPPALRPAA